MNTQYQALKERYIDSLILFRVGAFYELYHDDAISVATNNSCLTLAKRGDLVLIGIPIHALDKYLPQLLTLSKSVVVCDYANTDFEHRYDTTRKVVKVITQHTTNLYELIQQF